MPAPPGPGPGRALVGCSGWDYPEWRGDLYPEDLPRRRWFAWYAERFPTVELNSTAYRLPSEETVARWAEGAPDGFTYAVKVSQYGTHRRRLREPSSWKPTHVERIAGLGAHLGPQLLQLPPRWRRDVPRLDEALAAPPRTGRWAVEVRDPAWLHDDVFACLARHDVALCVHDLLPDHPWIRTTSWAYVRFHGPDAVHHAYAGRYGPRRLGRAVDVLGAWRDEGSDVHAYFNNDMGGHAPHDAAWLLDRLTR